MTKRPERAVRLCYLALGWYSKGFGGKVISRLIRDHLAKNYGIYLSAKAVIGDGLRMPHPVGIVIGDDVRIAEDVTIFQHVTLGRKHEDDASYPRIASGVTIYAGAVVLGRVDVGANAIIGANAVVVKDVPARTTVGGIPAKVLGVAD